MGSQAWRLQFVLLAAPRAILGAAEEDAWAASFQVISAPETPFFPWTTAPSFSRPVRYYLLNIDPDWVNEGYTASAFTAAYLTCTRSARYYEDFLGRLAAATDPLEMGQLERTCGSAGLPFVLGGRYFRTRPTNTTWAWDWHWDGRTDVPPGLPPLSPLDNVSLPWPDPDFLRSMPTRPALVWSACNCGWDAGYPLAAPAGGFNNTAGEQCTVAVALPAAASAASAGTNASTTAAVAAAASAFDLRSGPFYLRHAPCSTPPDDLNVPSRDPQGGNVPVSHVCCEMVSPVLPPTTQAVPNGPPAFGGASQSSSWPDGGGASDVRIVPGWPGGTPVYNVSTFDPNGLLVRQGEVSLAVTDNPWVYAVERTTVLFYRGPDAAPPFTTYSTSPPMVMALPQSGLINVTLVDGGGCALRGAPLTLRVILLPQTYPVSIRPPDVSNASGVSGLLPQDTLAGNAPPVPVAVAVPPLPGNAAYTPRASSQDDLTFAFVLAADGNASGGLGGIGTFPPRVVNVWDSGVCGPDSYTHAHAAAGSPPSSSSSPSVHEASSDSHLRDPDAPCPAVALSLDLVDSSTLGHRAPVRTDTAHATRTNPDLGALLAVETTTLPLEYVPGGTGWSPSRYGTFTTGLRVTLQPNTTALKAAAAASAFGGAGSGGGSRVVTLVYRACDGLGACTAGSSASSASSAAGVAARAYPWAPGGPDVTVHLVLLGCSDPCGDRGLVELLPCVLGGAEASQHARKAGASGGVFSDSGSGWASAHRVSSAKRAPTGALFSDTVCTSPVRLVWGQDLPALYSFGSMRSSGGSMFARLPAKALDAASAGPILAVIVILSTGWALVVGGMLLLVPLVLALLQAVPPTAIAVGAGATPFSRCCVGLRECGVASILAAGEAAFASGPKPPPPSSPSSSSSSSSSTSSSSLIAPLAPAGTGMSAPAGRGRGLPVHAVLLDAAQRLLDGGSLLCSALAGTLLLLCAATALSSAPRALAPPPALDSLLPALRPPNDPAWSHPAVPPLTPDQRNVLQAQVDALVQAAQQAGGGPLPPPPWNVPCAWLALSCALLARALLLPLWTVRCVAAAAAAAVAAPAKLAEALDGSSEERAHGSRSSGNGLPASASAAPTPESSSSGGTGGRVTMASCCSAACAHRALTGSVLSEVSVLAAVAQSQPMEALAALAAPHRWYGDSLLLQTASVCVGSTLLADELRCGGSGTGTTSGPSLTATGIATGTATGTGASTGSSTGEARDAAGAGGRERSSLDVAAVSLSRGPLRGGISACTLLCDAPLYVLVLSALSPSYVGATAITQEALLLCGGAHFLASGCVWLPFCPPRLLAALLTYWPRHRGIGATTSAAEEEGGNKGGAAPATSPTSSMSSSSPSSSSSSRSPQWTPWGRANSSRGSEPLSPEAAEGVTRRSRVGRVLTRLCGQGVATGCAQAWAASLRCGVGNPRHPQRQQHPAAAASSSSASSWLGARLHWSYDTEDGGDPSFGGRGRPRASDDVLATGLGSSSPSLLAGSAAAGAVVAASARTVPGRPPTPHASHDVGTNKGVGAQSSRYSGGASGGLEGDDGGAHEEGALVVTRNPIGAGQHVPASAPAPRATLGGAAAVVTSSFFGPAEERAQRVSQLSASHSPPRSSSAAAEGTLTNRAPPGAAPSESPSALHSSPAAINDHSTPSAELEPAPVKFALSYTS